ncbi:hypothetical protein BOTBODRAFT_470054 [Botryobasidium botryosum FD-172 SS1]|uniref:Uncharacterized protein n=1 Tax=Botryobasidium botryosum (strain FD-172 SS1) TaxID=930990 RepID=A0A067MGK0_BOTB1|nr:hypothetical protein BOTBODRAFT_470054 [Botryobasidium botryosum FD-172 SS1]
MSDLAPIPHSKPTTPGTEIGGPRYPALGLIGRYLDEIIKEYPDELQENKNEVLKLIQSPEEFHGSVLATFEVTSDGLIIMKADSIRVMFVGQTKVPSAWAGVYYCASPAILWRLHIPYRLS